MTGPAPAHSCSLPSRFDVGTPGTLNVGVAAEARTVVAVDITVPSSFHVDRVVPYSGWTSAKTGNGYHFSGGTIPVFQCGYFTFQGTATKKAVLAFDITTQSDDGSKIDYRDRDPASLFPAQLVLAGVEPDVIMKSGDKPTPAWVAPGAAVVGAAVAAGLILFVRRRRTASG